MKAWITSASTVLTILVARPAEAQFDGRLLLEPVIAFGFFGGLPVDEIQLDHGIVYGGRVAFRVTERWAVWGTHHRSNTGVINSGLERGVHVDHWFGGLEYSYVPRGGKDGWRPVLLEAGMGSATYTDGPTDFAVNLGASSFTYGSSRVGVRYGLNDIISNYDGAGIVHHVFARFGVEISM